MNNQRSIATAVLTISTILTLLGTQAKAESLRCEGIRPDEVKIQLEIDNFERGTIAYVHPVHGTVSLQGFQKDFLRETVGHEVYYVTEAEPHDRILRFPKGTSGDTFEGSLMSQDLAITCSLGGDLAPELEKPAPIVCDPKIDYRKALFEGIASGKARSVEEALHCGIDANTKTDQGCTALLYSTDLRCGEYLPQRILGDDKGLWTLGAQSPGNKNPISPALAQIQDLLVNNGALLDSRDPKNGETTLIKLVRNTGDSDLVASFAALEPNIDAQDMEGNTALMWATTLSTVNSEAFGVIRELSAVKADRNLLNKSGQTAYAVAKGLGMDEKTRDFQRAYDKRILRELKTASKTVTIQGKGGACTPLELTLDFGEAVELVLQGADKMYLMKAPRLSVELMAAQGEEAHQVITASQRGTFPFVCGAHGAAEQSRGTITVK